MTGVDTNSFYCYLLASEPRCDGETWAKNLNILKSQGLNPQYTVADQGLGHRAGHANAFPDVRVYGDLFHVLKLMNKHLAYYRNKLRTKVTERMKLEEIKRKPYKKREKANYLTRLCRAQTKEKEHGDLCRDLGTLIGWMYHDVFTTAGPDLETRRWIYDFIVDGIKELEKRKIDPNNLKKLRTCLKRQRDNLLIFALDLDEKYENLAAKFGMGKPEVIEVAELQKYTQEVDYESKAHWLQSRLGKKFVLVENAVKEIQAGTVRDSSLVENLNGRLRNYISNRRGTSESYLELLRFYFNHTPFLRSRRAYRKEKTPKEMLNGKPHPHWLELLGFEPFKTVA